MPRKATQSVNEVPPELHQDPMFQETLMRNYAIGHHVPKKPSLRATIQGLPSYDRAYQIFFTAQSTTFKALPEDIKEAFQEVKDLNAQCYVHAPYLLNLCLEPGTHDTPNYVVASLRKHLEVASAAGMKGVIVHVGKYTKQPEEQALVHMRRNLLDAVDAATPECPLLLETPAGQGTETLTTLHDFLTFAIDAAEHAKPQCFGVCVDTCHVFATGVLPSAYIKTLHDRDENLLRLIHFNDSKTPLGARVDRHEALGMGYIGTQELTRCAKLAKKYNIPALLEF